MRGSRRAGGVFWAGAALVAGVLVGLRLPTEAATLPVILAALAAAVLLFWSAAGADVPVAPLLAACLLCGTSLGLRSGARASAACTAELRRGAAVRATGLLSGVTARPSAGGGASRVRVELSGVELRSGGRECRVPSLAVWTDAGDRPAPGRAVRAAGRWRPYPSARGVRRPEHRGSLGAGAVRRATAVAGGPAGPPTDGLRAAAVRLRAAAAGRLESRLPPDAAGLARALTLADRGGLPDGLTDRFARAGLAHLLAISGLHVGVLAAAAAWLLGLRLPTGRRHLAAALLTGGYVAWIGAPASAVRASLLFAGWALARLRGSPIRTSDLLGAAAGVALLADPLTVTDAGFQLSFAGFGGVVLGAAAGRRWCEPREVGRRARGFLLTAAAGAGACALTAPLTALHFQRAAPVAAVSGLVGTPLVGLALFASLGVLLLPGTPLAEAAAGAATALLRGLTGAVDAFASVPAGHTATAPPGPVFWGVAGLLLWAWVRYVRGGIGARSWTPVAAAALVALAGPAASHTWAGLRSGGGTLVCTLDVGQGDAAAVRTRGGHWLLVDAGPGPAPERGGPDEGLSAVVPFLRDRGARSVELLALTHPHLDHVGGAPAVLDRIPVRRVAGSGSPDPGTPHLRFLQSVRAADSRWLALRRGDRMRLDEVEILVLDAGGAGTGETPGRDRNDTGVSLRIGVPDAGFAWVTTGDASMARETAMLRRWPADSLRADLLSVGHHGSRTATSPAWLEAVSPELAVISAGSGNRFGHPHPLTLLTLAEAGVSVRRTDRDGTVCVTARSDGSWRLER